MPRATLLTSAAKVEPLPWQSRPLLPIALAATLLGRSRSGVYQLNAAGKLRLVTIGGRTLVRTEDVVGLVESAQPFVPNAAPRGRARQMRDRAA